MSRLLNDLDSRFRPIACELIARSAEQLIPVMIITTLRTLAEQKLAVAQGVSWTLNSKHLAQPPENKSLAIDVCPYDQFQLHGPDRLKWDDQDPAWQTIGKIGQALGLKWGVVDRQGKRKDLGHFEYQVQPAVAPRTDGFVA